jgi:RimJ/RimL family protein N-acetyltransferase
MMPFIKGKTCNLAVLTGTDHEAETYARSVNAGWTTQHLFTGSIPMRQADVKAAWEREKSSGSIEFGIWSENGVFVGTCGLYSKRDIYRSWEFRILIFDPSAIGIGIGTEATRMTVNYGFKRLNAHRIWLGVNAENTRAVKCYKKVGFRKEGVLRDEIFCFGKYVDAIRMGILEGDWK